MKRVLFGLILLGLGALPAQAATTDDINGQQAGELQDVMSEIDKMRQELEAAAEEQRVRRMNLEIPHLHPLMYMWSVSTLERGYVALLPCGGGALPDCADADVILREMTNIVYEKDCPFLERALVDFGLPMPDESVKDVAVPVTIEGQPLDKVTLLLRRSPDKLFEVATSVPLSPRAILNYMCR